MKALLFERPGKVCLVEREKPKPGPDEVLVKIVYSGICGTDLHIIQGEAPCKPPLILGHEFSGLVAEVGKKVNHLKIGDAVAVDPNNYCGQCHYCRMGQVHFCENLSPVGVQRDGGWAQYCVVPADQVHPLPEGVPLEWGALGEPLSCILHGWNRLDKVSSQNRVLMLGSGLVGLLWGLLLRQHGFSSLLFSEPQESRRNIAINLGFRALLPSELADLIQKSKKEFDLIIDCSGNPAAIEQALSWLAPLGTFLFFGVTPMDSTIKLNPFQVFKKEWTLLGSVINPFTFQSALGFLQTLDISIEKLGVHFYALQEYSHAISEIKEGKITKGIFKFEI